MRGAPRTLEQIRSDACDTILLTITILAVPGVATSLLRGLEQGWKPVMGLHVAMLVLLAATTFWRKRLSFLFRAATVTAVPYIVGVGGLLAYGRGNGATMFFISSCVVAGCFFSRRTAVGVVSLCVATLAAIYSGYRLDLLDLPVNPGSYDMTPLSWLALIVGFVAAGIAPIIGLSALLQSLETERIRADEAAKVRSDFLANMSHELRTPMTSIIGMADGLKATPLNPQQQNLVSNLTLSGHNLLAVLNDLLDFTKFETGLVPIEKLPFRVSDLIRNTCAVFEARAAQKGLALKVELPEGLHDDVIGDSFRIGQVLSNLVDNAIKFTAEGAVTMRVEQRADTDGRFMLICAIIDSGIGIPPDKIERIFDPFIQADMSISRAYGGSGLGLAICRKLADALGGDISVASQPGKGSVFTMRVPVERGACSVAARPLALRAVSSSDMREVTSSLRLLVADDDANMRTLANIMLPPRGCEVTVAEDGAVALEAARRGGYDCILIDMHMPVMNGPEVMRAIQKFEAETLARPTPMIALTADVIPEHVRAFMDAGAKAVIAKPVEWDKLEAVIRALTNSPR